MAQSTRYRQLGKRTTELQRRFLPKPDPTGQYTERQLDNVRAFQLLVHAEIEAFLEDIAIGAVTRAHDGWKADGRARGCLLALLAYHEGSHGPAPTTLLTTQQKKPLSLRDRIQSAVRAYSHRIMVENHGIREENILRILLPIGILEDQIDINWLATIHAFGSRRGATAHKAKGRTTQPPDPQTEASNVESILRGLRSIDLLVAQIGRL